MIKSMCQLIETIKVLNKNLCNIKYHNQRMNKARKDLFNLKDEVDLKEIIKIPQEIDDKIYKCRVIYSKEIENIEFEIYRFMELKTLKLVYCNDIEYSYKYKNRDKINKLREKKENCDDIAVVKNGLITDGSYFNLVFFKDGRWYTPKNPLLNGTKREKLIKSNILTEKDINVDEIKDYSIISPINAFLDLEYFKVKII